MDDKETRVAVDLLKKLEALVVPDLRSMQAWARKWDARKRKPKGMGALNYALMMISLIGCEALGFYTTGALAHKRILGKRSTPDVGTYICDVISRFFPRGSSFKHVDKILADLIRHSLVHGFGTRKQHGVVEFQLALGVTKLDAGGVTLSPIGPLPTLVFDAVSLADDTASAFGAVGRRLLVDEKLRASFVSAAEIAVPIGRGIRNQVMAFRKRHTKALSRKIQELVRAF